MQKPSSTILGDMPVEVFLADYWQQKPLLIKQALPGFHSPISPEELAGLALEEDVESRLVTGNGEQRPWQLRHGPFDEATFNSLPKQDWTLLVQAVDFWVPEVKQLLGQFSFLPHWRVDDIMVSYAPQGGSVGPHYDHYDVFLVQGAGQRRWELGQICDSFTKLLADVDQKIMADFSCQQSMTLSPGDMLYLPPKLAHHGVSLDQQCMTYSIGFRSPSAAEMLDDLATELLIQQQHDYYADPHLTSQIDSTELPEVFIQQTKSLLLKTLDNDELLTDWFARYMTSPKYPELHEPVMAPADNLKRKIDDGSITRDYPNSRFLKTRYGYYLDGEKL